jgi:DNA-binding PadR family transcriptional regulator
MKKPKVSDNSTAPMPPAMFYILFALADGEKHGYAIMHETLDLSEGTFRMGPATLYTNVQRLLAADLIKEVESRDSGDAEPRRRYYRLSRQGKAALEQELQRMRKVLRRAQSLSLALKLSN